MTHRQRWTVLLGPALVLAGIVLPMALTWDELPNSMATHWDLGGTPNGHMPPMALLLVLGGIFVAMWLAVWYSARTSSRASSMDLVLAGCMRVTSIRCIPKAERIGSLSSPNPRLSKKTKTMFGFVGAGLTARAPATAARRGRRRRSARPRR